MEFHVNPAIFSTHPNLMIGVIIATDIDNTNNSTELTALLRSEEKKIRSTLHLETFKDHPNIAALQGVHRGFGNNPNKFPPSIQALLKRVLKGGELPIINPLVDLYNIISLRYICCIGAEDMDACEGNMELTLAEGGEHFIPLGESEEDPPEKGEYIYKDEKGVICRKLNWREGDRTKITEHTKNAIIVVEAFPPLSKELLEQMLAELVELLQGYCRAQTKVMLVTQDAPHGSF